MKDAFGILIFVAMVAFMARLFLKSYRASIARSNAEKLRWEQLGFRQIAAPLDEAARAQSHILRWGRPGDTFSGTFDGKETQAVNLWGQLSGRDHQSSNIRRFIVAFRQSARMPVFLLRTESALGNISEFFQPRKEDSPDIDFDYDPVFSAAYDLSGPDEAAVRARFSPAVTAYWARLASSAPSSAALVETFRWCAESTGDWILVYGPPPMPTDDLRSFLSGYKAAADTFTAGTIRPEAEALCDLAPNAMKNVIVPATGSFVRSVAKAFLGLVLGILLFVAVAVLFIWWQVSHGVK